MVWWTKWSLTEGRSIVKQLRGTLAEKIRNYQNIGLFSCDTFLRGLEKNVSFQRNVKRKKKKKKNTLLSLFVTTCQ